MAGLGHAFGHALGTHAAPVALTHCSHAIIGLLLARPERLHGLSAAGSMHHLQDRP
jgi:hypothetical protein